MRKSNHLWNTAIKLSIARKDNKSKVPKLYLTPNQERFLHSLGFEWKEINELLATRNPGCGICGKRGNLVVDHDHEFNSFRDLLCQACNAGLGMFKDNPKTLFLAMQYLCRHGK